MRGLVFIDKTVLLKLLRKALLYRLMNNLNDMILETKLTHRSISNGVGNSDNWFNDAYNNNEDIRISSLLRVLSVIELEFNLKDYTLDTLFDKKILEIGSLINSLSDENDKYIKDFIMSDKDMFVDLIGDWASMDYKKKLSEAEQEVFNQVRGYISSEEEGL